MISAVVINWNGKPYLDDCIGALLAQDPPPDEIILVDNHSDDGSREFVAERAPITMLRKLRVFAGPDHDHVAQQPQALEL